MPGIMCGDHVKFSLPMAFTITMLSWGVFEYHQKMADAGVLGHALEAIKWGTNYFVKARTHSNEDMTTSRRAYNVDAENPELEVAAESAAAMTAAAIVSRETNPHYSHLLLHHAQQ
ncbi:hypothetical protein SAY87_028404 [Trapa incisa]|uniref:cellulase n=1 Tax=Trapa incisa TaxID=236973 RepID=A0AAN7KUU2_9MYRT|nr:hypothetical protein SAY87_028404 [Trapa incisa]